MFAPFTFESWLKATYGRTWVYLHSEWSDLDKSAGRSPLWTVSLSSYGVCSCPAMDFFPSLKLTNKMPLKKSARGPKKEGMGETPTARQTHHVKQNLFAQLKLPNQETKVCGIATQVRHFSQQCGHGHAAFFRHHKIPSPAQPNSCGFGGLQIENGLIQGNLTYVFFAFIELGNKWKLVFFPLRPNNPPSKKRRDTEKCILNSVSKGETQIICQAGTKRIHPPWKFNTPPLRSYHSQKGRNIWSSKHHFSGATLLNFRLYFSWGNLTWGG